MTDGAPEAPVPPATPPIFRPPPPPPRVAGSPRPGVPPIPPLIEDPRADQALTPVPGETRGARRVSYEGLPALPTDLTAPLAERAATPAVEWAPVPTIIGEPARARRSGVAGVSLALSIVGLVASFFFGWGLPVTLAAIIVAIVALRRPVESRPVALWGLVLGVVGLVYSAGWLMWTAARLGLLG